MNRFAVESPEVQHAYIAIAEFFDAYALVAARLYVQRIMKAAGSYRYWKGNPSNVLFFFEKLDGLVTAALTIHREEAGRPAAVLALAEGEAPSLAAYAQYCGRHHQSHPWHFFPRSLNREEYANPYRVFAKLAGKGGRKRWRFLLRELQFFTLSTSSLNENEDVDLNTLQLYLLLTKLVEAAHLIDVRAIAEIGGEPRRKWEGRLEEAPAAHPIPEA